MSDADFKVEIPDHLWKKQFSSETVMSAQEMIDFNLEHSRKFMEGDFDGIMAESITDDAVWEFYPNRIRITGKEALRRYHEINYGVVIEQIDPDLTLDGLRMLAERNPVPTLRPDRTRLIEQD